MASDLTKEALAYAKTGRPQADLVLEDLREAVSLDHIKQACLGGGYPASNPHGELIRTKQKLATLLTEAEYAEAKNVELHKEALTNFQHEFTQHLLEGGNFGEAIHALSGVPAEPGHLKMAMQAITPYLIERGLDPVKAQDDSIEYEMVKGSSRRIANPDSPLVSAFTDLHKLASGHAQLKTSRVEVRKNYDEVEEVLKEAMVAHAVAV